MSFLRCVFGRLRQTGLWKDTRGVAYLEFALCLPFLLLLFAGSVDVTRMVLLHQKVDRAVFTVGDLATQLQAETGVCNTVKKWETAVVRDILSPFSYNNKNYEFVMSSVIGARPSWDTSKVYDLIEWRYNVKNTSAIGIFSNPYKQVATLPPSIRGLDMDERVIVTEMTYVFNPILPVLSGITDQTFRKVSYFRSRISTGGEGKESGVLHGC